MGEWHREPTRRDLEDYLRRRVADQAIRSRDDEVVPTPVDTAEEATTPAQDAPASAADIDPVISAPSVAPDGSTARVPTP